MTKTYLLRVERQELIAVQQILATIRKAEPLIVVGNVKLHTESAGDGAIPPVFANTHQGLSYAATQYLVRQSKKVKHNKLLGAVDQIRGFPETEELVESTRLLKYVLS